MALELAMTGELYDDLTAHLLQGRGDEVIEQVAFLFAAPYGDASLRVQGIERLGPNDFDIQTSYHVSLADHVRPAMIKRAWDEDACLIEAHSHADDGVVAFSGSDLRGFEEWVPHLCWRLQGRPYAALVFGYVSFDALAWVDSAKEPEPVSRLALDGRDNLHPTNRTYDYLTKLQARKAKVTETWNER